MTALECTIKDFIYLFIYYHLTQYKLEEKELGRKKEPHKWRLHGRHVKILSTERANEL